LNVGFALRFLRILGKCQPKAARPPVGDHSGADGTASDDSTLGKENGRGAF
jgi:hypothetical protein